MSASIFKNDARYDGEPASFCVALRHVSANASQLARRNCRMVRGFDLGPKPQRGGGMWKTSHPEMIRGAAQPKIKVLGTFLLLQRASPMLKRSRPPLNPSRPDVE
jgi:hypothetical protein